VADTVIALVSLLMNADMDLLISAHHEERVATRSVFCCCCYCFCFL